jgi:hypothetical protein
MSNVIQQQLEDIKQRLDAVEKKAESRQAVGPRGPAGPAGPKGQPGETGAMGPHGQAGRNGVDGRTPAKDEVDALVVQALHDYQILTNGVVGALLQHEIEQAVAKALAKK